jgi:hypothetical protein
MSCADESNTWSALTDPIDLVSENGHRPTKGRHDHSH